jgi:hypothetical protein
MEQSIQTGGSPVFPQDVSSAAHDARPLRCSICSRRLRGSIYFVEETGDVPEPRGSWTLCHDCNAAVHEQMEASPVRSPLRLRIAVGIVATDRTPASRRARFGQLSDRSWMWLFFWLFFITMLVHLAIIVAIAGIIK